METPCQPALARHSSWDHKPPSEPVNAAYIWRDKEMLGGLGFRLFKTKYIAEKDPQDKAMGAC